MWSFGQNVGSKFGKITLLNKMIWVRCDLKILKAHKLLSKPLISDAFPEQSAGIKPTVSPQTGENSATLLSLWLLTMRIANSVRHRSFLEFLWSHEAVTAWTPRLGCLICRPYENFKELCFVWGCRLKCCSDVQGGYFHDTLEVSTVFRWRA